MIKLILEKWLEIKGWKRHDYPYSRGQDGYQYSVYSHPDFSGVWSLDSAFELSWHQK